MRALGQRVDVMPLLGGCGAAAGLALNGITSNGTPKTLATSSVIKPVVAHARSCAGASPRPTTCSQSSCDMNGRRPTMCVTVLQSQPSVSIPTLTRCSARHGQADAAAARASSRAPRSPPDRSAGPADRVGQSRLPTVSSVNRIHRDSSDFACPVSVSWTTFESTRIVLMRPSALRKPSILSGGIPIGGLFSASHSYTTFAIAVFLQTTMKTGGRGSSFACSHAASQLFPQSAQHRDRACWPTSGSLRAWGCPSCRRARPASAAAESSARC